MSPPLTEMKDIEMESKLKIALKRSMSTRHTCLETVSRNV